MAAGLFDWQAGLPWYSLFLGVVVFGLGGWEGYRRMIGAAEQEALPARLAGPALWTVMVWALLRLAGPWLPHALLLPAAYLAWLAAAEPRRVLLAAAGLALLMEAGLALLGGQGWSTSLLNLLVYWLVAGMVLLARTGRVDGVTGSGESSPGLGFTGQAMTIKEALPPLSAIGGEADEQALQEKVRRAIEMQLELLRLTLQLTTVALLVADRDREELRRHAIVSLREEELLAGPYRLGEGVTGFFLRQLNEVALAPVKPGYGGLPYYRKPGGVGSIFAVKVGSVAGEGPNSTGCDILLLADRVVDAQWCDEERQAFQGAANKLMQEIDIGREYQALWREHKIFQRICMGLRELNQALGLESVLDGAVRVVESLAPLDFLAIALVQGESFRVMRLQGKLDGARQGNGYQIEEGGLVGQAIKNGYALPGVERYQGQVRLFTDAEAVGVYESLLVLPLKKEDGRAVGALAVGARQPWVLTKVHQEILSMIAGQLAIKIDLGQAHEQISQLATSDGLTELANHRAFQHGFDMMLDRARRHEHPICLILGDIDHFKKINDSYGHPFGDQVLKAVAGVLRNAVRKVDLAARYGGEEFALVLEKSDQKGGQQLAERIRSEVERLAFSWQGGPVEVTMSFGVAAFPMDGDDKQTLVDRADKALYHAKENGRNRSCCWPDGGSGASFD